MITKRQQFWVGAFAFVLFFFGMAYILGNTAMSTFLTVIGAWQVGQWGHDIWSYFTDKYVEKS